MKSKLPFKIPGLTALCVAILMAQAAHSMALGDPSPEFKLVEGIIRVSGTYDPNKASESDKYSSAISQVLDAYSQNRAEDPQAAMENLRKAVVDLNIYTPQQAEQFTERMQQGANRMRLISNGTSSNEMIEQQFPAAVADLLRSAPAGAQFSACGDASMTLANLPGIAGTVMLSMALVARIWNPNCQEVNVPALVASGAYGSANGTVTVYKQQKVCGPNPHVPWAESMAEWGGIAFGVSMVLDIILPKLGDC
jgi:hypothetical protein